VELAET
jgi:hypothetical protein